MNDRHNTRIDISRTKRTIPAKGTCGLTQFELCEVSEDGLFIKKKCERCSQRKKKPIYHWYSIDDLRDCIINCK